MPLTAVFLCAFTCNLNTVLTGIIYGWRTREALRLAGFFVSSLPTLLRYPPCLEAWGSGYLTQGITS